MRKIFLIFLTTLVLLPKNVYAKGSELYSQSFGKKDNPVIIFLHGGPGYNSYNFEFSTAQKLSNEGFYVIIFDQRGNGRSKSIQGAKYTFEEASNDLNEIYEKYNIKKASLIAHSFGGTIAIMFSEKYPEKLEKLFLVASPISYQKTFESIINKCEERYKKYKPENLTYIEIIKKMDKSSLEYSQACFFNALNCGLYYPQNSSKEAYEIFTKLTKSKDAEYLSEGSFEPVKGFYENEHYTNLDLSLKLKELTKKVRVYGIYGIDDGLFDNEQLEQIKSIIGKQRFTIVENSSHNIFIDQQNEFIKIIKNYINEFLN